MAWEPGTQIGSYEVVAALGNGGMGEVYKVRHVISQRTEAMKVLLPGTAQRTEVNERFVREIRVLATLTHPNIAALHNAFHHRDQLVMVMEFVEGMNLGERLSHGVTLEQSMNYVRQVLSALEYAHSRGIIHRDIKPSNIMLDAAGQVKLLDFGLALINTPDPKLTSSGSLLGSVHYISPEQIRGEPLDARSDLYALGVTFYELITGKLPIQGNSLPEIINGHLQHSPPSPSSVNAAVPEALSEIVLRAMAKPREERFRSAGEFLGALEGLAEDVTFASGTDWSQTLQHTMVWPATPKPKLAKPGSSGSEGAKQFTPAALDDITAQLANYIGPIAKIVVRRASTSSNNLRELCNKVAREIDSENARQHFLFSIQKHLRAN